MAINGYTEEQIEIMFNNVIRFIRFDKMSLSEALRQPETPAPETFYKWISNNETRAKDYARACESRADLIFEEILYIADNPQEGTTTKETEKGVEVITGDMIQHRRLQVDARKWILSKMNPKKYGDKLDVTTDGESTNQRPEFVFVNKTRKKGK